MPTRERDAYSAIRERMFGASARLGRYLILGRLGTGGMGVVHRAFDPVLGRPIALKLVRGLAVGDRDEQRLKEEAQALAQLSHPNVVPVFDIGFADGRMYIAMELVEGPTFDRWCRAAKRSRAEIVAALVGICNGLAAAHRVGIVHRDVKPSNVLISPTGLPGEHRPRVADFGLALPRDSNGTPDDDASSGPDRERTRVVEGTPAYMAPEQHLGAVVEPAADQYALCVMAVEALCGRRPFADVDRADLPRAKQRVPPTRPPSGIPRRLWAVLRRGLQPEPSRRWPSMDALSAALVDAERSPLVGAIAVVGIAVAIGSVAAVGRADAGPCDGGTPLDSVWTDARRTAGARAFEHDPSSRGAWSRVDARLTELDERWSEAQTIACSIDDPSAREHRLACLQRVRARAEAFALALADADADAIAHATIGVRDATDLAACDEVTTEPTAEPADDPRLATAYALWDLARTREAAALANEVLDTIGPEQQALRARALNLRARLDVHDGRLELAMRDYETAFHLALAAGLASDAFDIARALVFLHAERRRADDAEEWLQHAIAAARRSGGHDHDPALLHARSTVAVLEGRYDDAATTLAEEIALLRADEDTENLAIALQDEANVLMMQGRYREAEDDLRQSLAEWEQLGRRWQVEAAATRSNLAAVLAQAGRTDDAIAEYGRVIALYEELPTPPPRSLAHALGNRGVALLAAGRRREAIENLRASIVLLTAAGGDNDVVAAQMRMNLGKVLHDEGRFDEGLTETIAALEVFHAELGDGAPLTAIARANLADLLVALRRDDALAAARTAVLAMRRAMGEDNPYFAGALAILGEAEVRSGHLDEGVAAFDRALAIYSASEANPREVAEVADRVEAVLGPAGGPTAAEVLARARAVPRP